MKTPLVAEANLPSPFGRGAGGEGSAKLPSASWRCAWGERSVKLPSPSGRGAGGEGTSRQSAASILAARRARLGVASFAMVVVATTLSGSTAWLATITWNSIAPGPDWNMASNWGGTIPGSTDIGLFSAASYNSQPSLSSTAALGGIWDTGGGAVTIGGTSALTLFGTTINGNTGTGIEIDAGAGPLTINAPLVLQNNQQWLNNSAGALHGQRRHQRRRWPDESWLRQPDLDRHQ